MKTEANQIVTFSPSPHPAPYAFYFAQEQYSEAVTACERSIEHDPTEMLHYCYLGLALLLQGQETDAQIAWMTPVLGAEPEQAEQWLAQLVAILQAEARQQEAKSAYQTAWLLRQHLREIAPKHLENLLHLLNLELTTQTDLHNSELLSPVIQLLQQTGQQLDSISQDFDAIELQKLLQPVIQQILGCSLEPANQLKFLNACIPYLSSNQRSQLSSNLLTVAYAYHSTSRYAAAIDLAKLCVELSPTDTSVLMQVIALMQSGDTNSLLESIPLIEQVLQTATDWVDRVAATHSMLTSLMMTCSFWQKTEQYYQIHKLLLAEIQPATPEAPESSETLYRLLGTGMLLFYFEDEPAVNRPIRNQIAEAAQTSYRSLMSQQVKKYSPKSIRSKATKRLKIGYLSECLRVHSVGWLVRWLLNSHDRKQFEIHLYSTKQSNDFLQQSLISSYREHFHPLSAVPAEIADQIYQDEIDILVDLDSMTSFVNCAVATLKPAPIQVSWLGYDATGLPAIDYYIADPYVLPENAQDYYRECIWRLPQTYIAVNGFEVGVPSLRREQLNIPDDAIVYLSSQTGLKRNPDNVRLQLQILKHVPKSYFLIKSFNADPQSLQAFFLQLADEEGINHDRLRFLPDFPENSVHRANLRLADVVLDTYPYNGATTTLEALWMGLPIVTRVGEQFAARNSYTMMKNVGMTEGIAWTDEEYINWGIRLGEDADLRCNINYQLRQSRHTSPLWNAQQFARDLENAYEQMWRIYCDR